MLDRRGAAVEVTPGRVQAVADRRAGVGCDQLITIDPDATHGVAMAIWNADGSASATCGNAARCVADILMREAGSERVTFGSPAGPLTAWREPEHREVTVDMGPPRLDWRDIPLAEAVDTLHLPITAGPLAGPVAVSMGNPHMVFAVPDAEAVDLATLGPRLEHHPLYPDRANVEAVSLLGPDHLRMRVWERGAGITKACGSGACAAVVATARRGITGPEATVSLDGGDLHIRWRRDGDGHVEMTGPVATAFAGVLDRGLWR